MMVLQAEIDKVVAYTKQSCKENLWQLVAIGAVVVGVAGYYGYGWWQQHAAMKAQVAFSDAYEAYQHALRMQFTKNAKPEDRKELLEKVEVDLSYAYNQHRRSAYAPYFKAFAAQVALQQGNRDAALAFMHEAVGMMGARNPYRGLYEINLALMTLDGNEAQAREGLQLLETIAQNNAHAYQDMALYYVGLWYQAHADYTKAHSYWQRIAEPVQAASYEQARSPWRTLVESYVS